MTASGIGSPTKRNDSRSRFGFPSSGTLLLGAASTTVTYTGTTATTFTGVSTASAATGGGWPVAALRTPAVGVTAGVGNGALIPAGTGTIGGYVKVELQDNNNVWHDVTMEVLNYGIAAPNGNPFRG